MSTKVLPAPLKSSTGEKKYRVIELANGLRVLLVSDKRFCLNALDEEERVIDTSVTDDDSEGMDEGSSDDDGSDDASEGDDDKKDGNEVSLLDSKSLIQFSFCSTSQIGPPRNIETFHKYIGSFY